MRGTIRFDRGVHHLPGTLYIGSMRVVGSRNFVVRSALAALYGHVLNLIVLDRLKQGRTAGRAIVGVGPLSSNNGTDKVGRHDGPARKGNNRHDGHSNV